MHLLPGTQFQIIMEDIEIGFEIGNRILIRVIIVYAKTSSYINPWNLYVSKFFLKIIYTLTENLERGEVSHLRTDMEMEAFEVKAFRFHTPLYKGFNHCQRDAEFVLSKACGDVMMCMRIYLRIYSQSNRSLDSHSSGELLNYVKFGR